MLEKILDSWPLLIILPAIVAVGFYGFFKHAIKHTDGSDDIQTADEAQKGLMSATHVQDLNGFPDELKNLITAEIQQIENMGDVEISYPQWGYLGALANHPDKPVEETDTSILLLLNSQSDIDWTDVDANTVGSGLVPIDATAVWLEIAIKSATVGAAFSFRKKGDDNVNQRKDLSTQIANQYIQKLILVGLDANGVFQYCTSGCGTNDTNIRIYLAGWIEPS